MTDATELQAATDRLRALRHSGDAADDYLLYHIDPADPDRERLVEIAACRDRDLLADAYIDAHPAPGPVTADGLRRLGFTEHKHERLTYGIVAGDNCVTVHLQSPRFARIKVNAMTIWGKSPTDIRDVADLIAVLRRIGGGT